jgi:hypothetical protein
MCTVFNTSSGFRRCFYYSSMVKDAGSILFYEHAFCHCIGIDIIACFFVFGVWRGIEGNISGLNTRNMNEYSMLDLISISMSVNK